MKDYQQTILLVEDEVAIREMLRLPIEREGFCFTEAGDTVTALKSIKKSCPDLILLDWMLPGQNGIAFASLLKQHRETASIPIIMLTARAEEADKLQGFNAGIDDYLSKPFSIKELLARIQAVLRRSQKSMEAISKTLKVADLVVEIDTHRVKANGHDIKLGPIEFRLLRYFMESPERVHSRGRLLNRVWGETVYVEERTVDVHIRRLRKALAVEQYDRFIQTVRGAGYRFSSK